MKNSLSLIMSNAWELYKNDLVKTFSEALKTAWKIFKFKKALFNGIVNFTFIKKNGEERPTFGTRNSSNFLYSRKTSGKKSPAQIIKFWDVDAQGWRSCDIFKVVSIG